MKYRQFLNNIWFKIIIYFFNLIITIITIKINVIPLIEKDFVKINIKTNPDQIKKQLTINKNFEFILPYYSNFNFKVIAKNKEFIKKINNEGVNSITFFIEKESFIKNFKDFKITKNNKIIKTIYIFGILINNKTILNLKDVLIYQRQYNLNYIILSMSFWVILILHKFLENKFIAKVTFINKLEY